LKKLLASLPKNIDKNVLVGFDTSDDAGVYRLNDEQALVFTADFITPPVMIHICSDKSRPPTL